MCLATVSITCPNGWPRLSRCWWDSRGLGGYWQRWCGASSCRSRWFQGWASLRCLKDKSVWRQCRGFYFFRSNVFHGKALNAFRPAAVIFHKRFSNGVYLSVKNKTEKEMWLNLEEVSALTAVCDLPDAWGHPQMKTVTLSSHRVT